MNKLHMFIALMIYFFISTVMISYAFSTYATSYIETVEYGKSFDDSNISFSMISKEFLITLIPYSFIIFIFYILPAFVLILIGISFFWTPIGQIDVGD